MVYKKYIKRDGKVFGPYYYESYRDSDGNVKTRFISGPSKLDYFNEICRVIAGSWFFIGLVVLILLFTLLLIGNANYGLTGHVVYEPDEVSDDDVRVAQDIIAGNFSSKFDMRGKVDSKVRESFLENNKILEFVVPEGKISLKFDLLNYSKFVSNSDFEEVDAENFDIEIDESYGRYKWGYDVKLSDLDFMAKIDVESNVDILVIDNQTLKIGENYLSFADLTSEGYILSVERPVVMSKVNFSLGNVSVLNETNVSLGNVSSINVTEVNVSSNVSVGNESLNNVSSSNESVSNLTSDVSSGDVEVAVNESSSNVSSNNKSLVESNESVVVDSNETELVDEGVEVDEIESNESDFIEEEGEEMILEEGDNNESSIIEGFLVDLFRPLIRFFAKGFNGITGFVVSENKVSIYVQRDFSNTSYKVGDLINLDPTIISGSADANLTACQRLGAENTTYTLQNNIVINTSTTGPGGCLDINVSNIILDFNGYNITGDHNGSLTGNFLSNVGVGSSGTPLAGGASYTPLTNVTIKNGAINNFSYGIHFGGVPINNSVILNMSSNFNQYYGYYGDIENSNNITDVKFNGNVNSGYYIYRSTNNRITNVTANNNGVNGLQFLESSNNSVFKNVNLSGNDRGIYLDGKNHTFNTVNMTGNRANIAFVDIPLNISTHSINGSNVVDGSLKIYINDSVSNYIYNTSNSPNVGFLVCTNCVNITIINMDFSNNNSFGLYLNATGSTIHNVTSNSNRDYGIYELFGVNNSYINVATNNNFGYGILSDYSNNKNNTYTNITANNNGLEGIKLTNCVRCNLTTITTNSNNRSGLVLGTSNNASLRNIISNSNSKYGVELSGTSKNVSGLVANSNNWSGVIAASTRNIWNNFTLNSNKRYGIYVNRQLGNNLSNSSIWNCSSAGSFGCVRVDSSNLNFFNNVKINLSAGVGVRMQSDFAFSSTSNLFSDFVITNISNYSVFLSKSGSGKNSNTIFINVTYNNELVKSGAGSLIRKWYYRAFVNDTNSNVIPNASVRAYDKYGVLDLNLTTNASGWTEIGNITEYNNSGTKDYLSNYIVVADNDTLYDSHNFNVSLELNKLNDTFVVVNDTIKPILSGTNWTATTSTATITWNTDEGSNSSVTYWASPGTTVGGTDGFRTANHSVKLTGLTSNKTYNYYSTSCDFAGNCNSSANFTFKTAESGVVRGSSGGGLSCLPNLKCGVCSGAEVGEKGSKECYDDNSCVIGSKYTVPCTVGNDISGVGDSIDESDDGSGEGETSSCIANWDCSEWGECEAKYTIDDLINEKVFFKGEETRKCIDKNSCLVSKVERKVCETKVELRAEKVFRCNEEYIEIYDLNGTLISRLQFINGTYNKLNVQIFLDKDSYCPYCYDNELNYDEDEIDCVYTGNSCPICGKVVIENNDDYVLIIALIAGIFMILIIIIVFIWEKTVFSKRKK